MSQYPEHDKLMAVKDEAQKLGDFIEWLKSRNLYYLCGFVSKEPGYGDDYYYPTNDSTEVILGKYFNIDLDKLEEEKLLLIKEQRALNARKGSE